MRHFAANHILLLRKVTFIGILHCCEAYRGCSGTLPLHFAVRYIAVILCVDTAKYIASGAAADPMGQMLFRRRAGHIASAQPTYRFCAEVMFAYGIIIYVRSVVLSGCFFAAAEHIGVQRHAVRAKISRPEQGRTSSLIAHCALAQDIILFPTRFPPAARFHSPRRICPNTP